MALSSTKKVIIGGLAVAGIAGAAYYILTPKPSITLDFTNLVSSGVAVWAASGMDPSHVYVVGAVLADGTLHYNPNIDTRVNSSSADGVYALSNAEIGAAFFILYDQTAAVVAASIPVTVSAG